MFAQLLDQIMLGIERHQRHPQAIGQALPTRAARLAQLAVALAQGSVVGVELQPCVALAEAQQPGCGQCTIEGVEHWQQQQIDMAREQTELLFGGVAQGAFVAEDHRQATGPEHFAYAA